jgi:hypothetical protein
MAKTIFQRYTTASGEKYQFELTEDGVIYLFDRSNGSRSQLNEGDRAAIERGLITIGEWESNPREYERTLELFVRELKRAKADLHPPVRKAAAKRPTVKRAGK